MRLNETVSDTLRLARSGALGSSPISLNEPVRAAVAAAGPIFKHHRARLEVDLGPTTLNVNGDSGALEQVFLNLLQNAAQALGPDGGNVTLTGSAEKGGIAISLQDDGAGMTAGVMEQVFEPLFSTRPEGTGLGLTIARRIVDAHGGEISFESTPGSGTLVRVWLPLSSV
jgi:two-component system sensor histidine kinase AtoS